MRRGGQGLLDSQDPPGVGPGGFLGSIDMKKRERKLQLNRETLKKIATEEMAKVEGGLLRNDAFNCTGCDSGCGIID